MSKFSLTNQNFFATANLLLTYTKRNEVERGREPAAGHPRKFQFIGQLNRTCFAEINLFQRIKEVKQRLKDLALYSIPVEETNTKYTVKTDDLSTIHTM